MAEGPDGAEGSDRIRDARLAKLEKLEASGVRAFPTTFERSHRAQEGERLAPFARLTVRECEVLQDLIEGKNADLSRDDGEPQ